MDPQNVPTLAKEQCMRICAVDHKPLFQIVYLYSSFVQMRSCTCIYTVGFRYPEDSRGGRAPFCRPDRIKCREGVGQGNGSEHDKNARYRSVNAHVTVVEKRQKERRTEEAVVVTENPCR